MSLRAYALPICCLVCAGSTFAQPAGIDTCGMKQPPEGALRRTLPGGMAEIKYPDPRTVPNDYTGCLNTWLDGIGPPALLTVARFRNGITESVSIPAHGLNCEYQNDSLVPDPARKGHCLDTKDVTLEKWRLP
jgi:hypothetical protein